MELAELAGALGGVSEDVVGVMAIVLVAGGAGGGIAAAPPLAGGLDEHATSMAIPPDTSARSHR